MKKKTVVLSFVLALSMIFGAAQISFAGVPGFETFPSNTPGTPLVPEYDVESVAVKVANETVDGGYQLTGTQGVKDVVDNYATEFVILDTMPPAASYDKYHVPGAINYKTPLGSEEFTAEDKAGLLKAVDAAAGTVRTKQYYNSKTKKWQNKKPAAKNWKGKKTRKKITYNKPIIVYCGFVKCDRSHVAAKYLVEQGYKNVYRYTGGISAWLDAGYPTEGAGATLAQ